MRELLAEIQLAPEPIHFFPNGRLLNLAYL